MAAISEEVKKEVNGVLKSVDPVLVKVQKLTSVLLECGLAYRTELKPCDVLVHPQNRSGQMLSSVDCWSKGLRMWNVGVRKELLTDSFALGLRRSLVAIACQVLYEMFQIDLHDNCFVGDCMEPNNIDC